MANLLIPAPGGAPRLVYGWDGTDWRALLVDAAGNLQVDVVVAPSTVVTIADGADVTLGALADAAVVAGAAGSVSAKLRRLTTDLSALLTELALKADLTETQPVSAAALPLPAGAAVKAYQAPGAGIVEEQVSDTSAAAGTNILLGAAVPAGEAWCITTAAISNYNTVCSKVLIYGSGLASDISLLENSSPAAFRWDIWNGCVWLQAGDKVAAAFYTCVLNDDIYLRYCGYKVIL